MNPSTSAARIAANRANALLSTGPTTDAGKLASRRNALKHGLTSKIVDLEALEQELPTGVDADGRLDANYLKTQIVLTMSQIQRAQQIQLILRNESALRATVLWDEDRTLEAAAMGEKLLKRPGWTVTRLQLMPRGCDWLIERWRWLARAAATSEGWNETLTKLAFGLLGIDAEGQIGTVLEAVAGRRANRDNPPTTHSALAETMIAELEARQEVVAEVDAMQRALAIDDATDLPSPDLARLRRYVATLHRRLEWLLKEQRINQPVAPAPRTASTPPTPTQTPPRPPAPRSEPRERRTNPIYDETKPTILPPEIAAALPELAFLLANPPQLIEESPYNLPNEDNPHFEI